MIRMLLVLSALVAMSAGVSAQQKTSLAVAPVGGVYNCARIPQFVHKAGLQQPVAIDTSMSQLPGVVIRELTGQKRMYQPDAWKVTGHVGSTVRDAQGNIYIVPIPSVALDSNPLSKRNTVYRIRSDNGDIEVYKQLPLPEKESQQNPFGVVGLAIDCTTNRLYVSSLAGSEPNNVAGKIYQIDLTTGKLVDVLSGVDALGLAIFNHQDGKRLYFGDARSSSLYSLSLTNNGRFKKNKTPKYELSLLEFKNGDSTQIRKIRISKSKAGAHLMTLDDTEFAYRLAAETNRKYKKYTLALDNEDKKWRLLSIR